MAEPPQQEPQAEPEPPQQEPQAEPGPPQQGPPQQEPQAAAAAAEPEQLYSAEGEHGRAGYYVKTVGNAPVAAPTKLNAEEAAQKQAPKRTGSAWNTGGTWENKDVTKWAKVSLPPLFEGQRVGDIAVRSATLSSGHASVVLVRGKMRPGFDLKLELEWEQGEPKPPAAAAPPAEGAGEAEEEQKPEPEQAQDGAMDEDKDDEEEEGDTDDDEEEEEEEEEEDDGVVRGKLTVEATDLDDEDDYELAASVSKGGLSAYEAGKQLERLRPMLYAQLKSFAAQIVESVTE